MRGDPVSEANVEISGDCGCANCRIGRRIKELELDNLRLQDSVAALQAERFHYLIIRYGQYAGMTVNASGVESLMETNDRMRAELQEANRQLAAARKEVTDFREGRLRISIPTDEGAVLFSVTDLINNVFARSAVENEALSIAIERDKLRARLAAVEQALQQTR